MIFKINQLEAEEKTGTQITTTLLHGLEMDVSSWVDFPWCWLNKGKMLEIKFLMGLLKQKNWNGQSKIQRLAFYHLLQLNITNVLA